MRDTTLFRKLMNMGPVPAFMLTGLMLASVASGQNSGFNTTSGDWNNAANWTNGNIPDGTNGQIYVGRSPVDTPGSSPVADVTIVGAPANASTGEVLLAVGAAGNLTGTLSHSTGSLTSNGWTIIGADAMAGTTNTGTLNLTGNAEYTSTDQLHLGVGGGPGSGLSQGTINIADDAVLNTNVLIVGNNDGNLGTVNQSGGRVNNNTWLSIGTNATSTGVYNLTGGTVNSTNDWTSIGEFGTGTFNISGDAVFQATANGFIVARENDSNGTLNIVGDAATIFGSNFHVGANAAGADNSGSGSVNFIAAAGGVSVIQVAGNTILGDSATLTVDLTATSFFGSVGLDADGDGIDDNTGQSGVTWDLTLVDNNSSVTNGLFIDLAGAQLLEGGLIDIGGGQFGVLSYVGGADSLDVTVSVFKAIPEPTSVIVLAGFAACGLIRRKRN